jgi:hypothetical protein
MDKKEDKVMVKLITSVIENLSVLEGPDLVKKVTDEMEGNLR